MAIYDVLRGAHAEVEALWGQAGPSLVVWIAPDVTWSCGACFSSAWRNRAAGADFDTQIWQTERCVRTNLFDLRLPAPMFADYLDALRCLGVDDAAVREAARPDEAYPYPIEAPPRCREGD